MVERCLFDRALVLALSVFAAGALVAGCADGNTTPTGHRDTGIGDGAVMDSGVGSDTGVHDSAADTNADAFGADTGLTDTGPDTGPHVTVMTCEACTTNADCDATSFCAHLVTGEHACLPGCDTEFPHCPRGFTCIFDATGTGVHANICAPVGGPCCVDEDADTYGVGVGCMGPDCNDMSATVHPDRDEICDGLDTNCNTRVDENPNDCGSGRCTPDGDGTYTAIVGGMCVSATCQSGTTTDCMLYTCSGGGTMGTTCATMCAPAGTDDNTFCIATAHCDTGVCVANVPNGGTCDEDSDCTSSHCDNGYCCGSGTCCATDANCPGGGTPTRICDDPTHCQGHRGVVTCQSNSCTAMSGIDDDTACDTSTLEASCGLYNSLYCSGTDPQTARTCATSCLTDGDCIAAAHCTFGFCLPDLPPGGSCGRNQDCMDGLTCVDSVCCMSACNGSCEACNLPGFQGACMPIPAGADPAGECPGFSCSNYYTGFSSGSDVCSTYQPVSDSAAACDGAGACRTADVMCPMQPIGGVQVDCNNTCQAPRAGTCNGMTAGVCDNLDNPAIMTMCGIGDCTRMVQACTAGAPTTCTPGTPTAEVCDGRDNDCNGTIDNGGAALCPAEPHVDTQVCNGTALCSVAPGGCSAGYADYDMMISTGCECDVSGSGAVCTSSRNLGSIPVGGSASIMANIPPGGSSWFTMSFPAIAGTGGRGGTPTITVSPSASYRIAVFSNCTAGTYTCNAPGDPANSGTGAITTFAFTDSIANSPSGTTLHMQTWPDPVYVQVTRTSTATSCAQAAFTLTVTR